VRLDFSPILSIKWAQEYYKFVLNILRVTYFATSSVAVFEAAITGKINVRDKVMTENEKKKKIWKDFIHKLIGIVLLFLATMYADLCGFSWKSSFVQ